MGLQGCPSVNGYSINQDRIGYMADAIKSLWLNTTLIFD